MTRKILFRGKRVDKDVFIEGDLIHGVGHENGRIYILPIIKNLAYLEECHPLDGYEVIQETIGQFTGLTDKNGNKIFEGDIVESEYNSELFSVKYLDGSFVGDNSDFEFGILSNFELTRSEIIGNIHDNMEL